MPSELHAWWPVCPHLFHISPPQCHNRDQAQETLGDTISIPLHKLIKTNSRMSVQPFKLDFKWCGSILMNKKTHLNFKQKSQFLPSPSTITSLLWKYITSSEFYKYMYISKYIYKHIGRYLGQCVATFFQIMIHIVKIVSFSQANLKGIKILKMEVSLKEKVFSVFQKTLRTKSKFLTDISNN